MVAVSSSNYTTARMADGSDSKWALKPHRTVKPPTKESPLLVVVLDGWGAQRSLTTSAPCRSACHAAPQRAHVCTTARHACILHSEQPFLKGETRLHVSGEARDADDNAIALAGDVHAHLDGLSAATCSCA
jgi:hypothetical protein